MRVAVAGALGRMGRTVCAALLASDGMELVGGFDREYAGESLREVLALQGEAGVLYDELATFYNETRPHVVVDFTTYPGTVDVAREAIERRISPVIGATGWMPEDEVVFADLCDEQGVGALLVPNFALGAVLLQHFAEIAAKHFPTVEIVELHHTAKLDAPSGTAKRAAEAIGAVRRASGMDSHVPIHSVRLSGLVAHQEVLFGGTDEILTLRHDSLSRQSFMPGVLLAVQRVRALSGLVKGLGALLIGEVGS